MNRESPFGQPGPLPFGQPALNAGTLALKSAAQFSLMSLFEFTTICCLIAALSSLIGLTAGLFLMAFALSLLIRNGASAIIMLMSASLAAGLVATEGSNTGFISQLAIFPTAALISWWYRFRAVA
jgi:hypothetical protein